VLGSDPFRIEELVHRMFIGDFARVDDIAGMGIALVEMACWDIVGKALKQPVYQLLGGAVRDKIKAYANGWYTGRARAEGLPRGRQEGDREGLQGAQGRPVRRRPLRDGAGGEEPVDLLIEAIRDSVGPDVEILIEMHGRFSPATAIELSADLEKFKPSWVEEPVPPDNLEAMAKAAAKINIPVATGERIHTRFETRRLLELGAIDILQTDITESMGCSRGRRSPRWRTPIT
jgi:galactonate dehydratase